MGAERIPSSKILLLVGIFAIAAIPRFAFISKGPFHYDTLDYVIAGKKTLETGSLHYAHGVGYPLTVILSAFSQLIFGFFLADGIKAVLIITVIGASLATLAFFIFVDFLFKNKKIALFSALIFSFFPPFFSVTTYGRLDHAFALLFVISSFYFLFRHLRAKNVKYLVYSSVFLGLAVCTRFSTLWTVFPYLFVYVSWNSRLKKNKLIVFKNAFTIDKFVFSVFPAILTVTAFYLPMFLNSGISRFIEVISNPYQAKWMGLFTPLLTLSISWMVKSLTYLGIALGILGIYFIFKEKKFICFFSVVWVILLTLYFGNLSSVSPRYLILPSLPLFFVIGFSIHKIEQFRKYLGLTILAILIFWTVYPIYPILEFRHSHNMQKEFAMYLKNITEENAIILAKDEGIFLRYYLESTNRSITSFPSTCNQVKMDEFFERMDSWLGENRSVYIIETGFAYDPCGLFLNTLLQNYNLTLVGKHLNEDWHHKSISPGLFEERVFKITKRKKI